MPYLGVKRVSDGTATVELDVPVVGAGAAA
jgi:hypothetical protein